MDRKTRIGETSAKSAVRIAVSSVAVVGGSLKRRFGQRLRRKGYELAAARAQADIEGDMADAPSHFTAIRMSVSAQCNPPEELNKLVTIAERGCIAANTLLAAVKLSIKVV